jgi:lysophospholipase L1-like esterase
VRKVWNCYLFCFIFLIHQLAVAQRNSWVATWATSSQALDPSPNDPLSKIDDQTVRERVRVSIGAGQIRIRLSNEFGSAPLLVGAATVAMPTTAPERVKPGSIRVITFGGQRSVTIPAGAPVLSDPVAFSVMPNAEISISLYFPKKVATPTIHALALKRTVISRHGDSPLSETLVHRATSDSSVVLSAVLVPAQGQQRLVVAFGDSITDGDGSTPETDHTWPSDLNRRLGKSAEGPKVAVVNEGIAGNRLLGDGFGVNALARFDRDVLAVPGVTHVVLLEGINDISFPGAKLGGEYLAYPADARSYEEIIGAYSQLIVRAHARGIKVIGATMTPNEGVVVPGYYSEAKNHVRETVNHWIRTSGAFDGVIDFDAVLRDPQHPSRLLPRFALPDHLHPNDAGYQAMADAIDLALFR